MKTKPSLALAILFLVLMASAALTIVRAISVIQPAPTTPDADLSTRRIVAIIATLLASYGLLLGAFVASGRARSIFPKSEIAIKPGLSLPLVYLFPLATIIFGVVVLLLGETTWGLTLIVLALPQLIIFYLVLLTRKQE